MTRPLLGESMPESAVSRPAKIFISVDLPEPFGPIRPILSFDEIPNDRFSNRAFVPKDLESDWQLIRRLMNGSIINKIGVMRATPLAMSG